MEILTIENVCYEKEKKSDGEGGLIWVMAEKVGYRRVEEREN